MVVRKVSELGELSAAEQQVIAELDTGESIVLGDGSRPEADEDGRRVRAALIRLLLLGDDEEPKYRLHEKGLRIAGAWIPDCLDLEGGRDLRDVGLANCHFAEAPVLRSAELGNLFLNRSCLPGIYADRLEARGGVFLRGAEATREVQLRGAKLGGNLECIGAKFRAEKDAQGNPGKAFAADGLEAGGSVFLRDVEATGEVRVLGAKLGGQLSCNGATFRAEKDAQGNPGNALSADRVEAGGGVFLHGVEATGEVRLAGAKLGGDLSCNGAKFRAEKDAQGNPGSALSADRLEAGGVFLHGVEATGEVRLLGARLGGNLECAGAKFRAEKDAQGNPGKAFGADGLEAAGSVFLSDVEAIGEVRLLGAKLGGGLSCTGAKFRAEKYAQGDPGDALSADRLEAGGFVFLRRVEATGAVRLVGAKLGGNLECDGAKFRAEKDAQGNPGSAFSAEGLEAVGGAYLRKGFEATGVVRLVGAKLGGNLDCDGAKFRAGTDGKGLKGLALSLDGVRVDGGFFLRNGAQVDGVLNLTAAEVGRLNDTEASWPAPGLLILNRFQYGAITDGSVGATRRLDWLGRQDPTRWGTDFWPQPYEQLAKVLREMGHDDDARTVLIAKEHKRRWSELRRMPWWDAMTRGPFHIVFTLLLWMVGYGYRPARALIPALAIVLLGWLIIDRAAEVGALVPASPAGAVALVPLAYSFEAFVPIVRLSQTDVFRPDMATGAGWWLQVYLWLHGLAGWLIGGIAAAGVLGLFRRE